MTVTTLESRMFRRRSTEITQSDRPTAPRSRKLRTVLVSLGVVTALAAAGVGSAEIYYRHETQRCVAAQVENDLGSDVAVHFGPKPLLITRFDNRIPYVIVGSDDARFGPAVDMRVHARLNDIELSDGGRSAAVGNSTADATWSNDGIAKTLRGLVSGVTSDPSTGTIDVTALGGLAHLQLRPYVVDHKIRIDTVSTRGIPTDLTGNVIDIITESLQSYPLNLQAEELKVTGTGITVHLTGGHTTLEANSDSC
ncbi:LmeA family phospholipid-binding protein [Nocardia vinacea]|uniref:LmeA family phospholipid-binding protein n=1 Tax=Nocardia vinacea TaxID=96468 RepID=UPI0003119553|nr:DUF2993 domain-containing protein [Nocardia vinacea]